MLCELFAYHGRNSTDPLLWRCFTAVPQAMHVKPIACQDLTCLHGRLQEAMRDFRSGKVTTLVATDVAGRGLHISRWA